MFDTRNTNSIVDATVEVIGTELKTTTGSDGRYQLSGITSSTVPVRYTHPSYNALEREYTLQRGTERLDLNAGLTPPPPPPTPTTTIGGTVRNMYSGSPLIPNVTVEIVSPASDASLKTTTDSGGRYRLSGIRSARFNVRYSHSDFQSTSRDLSFQPGTERLDIDIRLIPTNPPETTLEGQVWGDCSGKVCLIEGAEVIVLNSDGTNSSLQTTTNSEGRYRLSGIRSVTTVQVRYRHPNFRAAVIEYNLVPGTTMRGLDVGLAAR